MWRLDVSSEAELEIFEAALRYEHELIGLGVRFETQVDTVFARLLDNPFQFPLVEEGARRASFAFFRTPVRGRQAAQRRGGPVASRDWRRGAQRENPPGRALRRRARQPTRKDRLRAT